MAEAVGEVLGSNRAPVRVGEQGRTGSLPARPGAGTGIAGALRDEAVLEHLGVLKDGSL